VHPALAVHAPLDTLLGVLTTNAAPLDTQLGGLRCVDAVHTPSAQRFRIRVEPVDLRLRADCPLLSIVTEPLKSVTKLDSKPAGSVPTPVPTGGFVSVDGGSLSSSPPAGPLGDASALRQELATKQYQRSQIEDVVTQQRQQIENLARFNSIVITETRTHIWEVLPC
jgi:hypothetical protein